MFLAQANIINLTQHEIVIERAMALPQALIHLDEIRWVVLMVLRKQGKTKDFLFVEDAMFHEDQPTLH
jgi:Smg protein